MAKKIQLSYKEIEDRLKLFKDRHIPSEEIGYQLLHAFGKPEREIERYKEGKGVIKTFDGLLIKGLFCYKSSTTLRFADELDNLKSDSQVLKSQPKIVATSDGITIRAYDLRQKQTFEQKVDRLYCDFEFFYPLAGVERIEYVEESPADIKAAEKLARLHDEIRAYNEFTSDSDLHDLNTFIARLLFCFFAEDTGIFPEHSFTNAIKKFGPTTALPQMGGSSDLKVLLEQLFRFMGGKAIPPGILQTYCQQHFAFVGGGLFERNIYIPELSMKARQIIIDSGELDWQNINPDIFGSMIQAVVNPDVRANQGMHYTSVPNIMKVINPLFLDELRGSYNKIASDFDEIKKQKDVGAIYGSQFYTLCKPVVKRCDQLLLRISKMKFFDPACGSGNFLIITYKMLRLLEMDILSVKMKCGGEGALQFIDGSCISLHQFYGIELLDFPHEVAMLSLWLAEHQMNKKMREDFGVNTNALPLHDINNIRCGNACRIDWNEVCPHTKEEEVFVFGNPPYYGTRNQEPDQKIDMDIVFGDNQHGMLDYIACWFYKASLFIKDSIEMCYAFVSTNSITQGVQVPVLWPLIFKEQQEIVFAYKSFDWTNNAKNKAAVICVIIGIASIKSKRQKLIYDAGSSTKVENIAPTIDNKEVHIITPTTESISGLKPLLKGSLPADENYLTLYKEDKNDLIEKYPFLSKYIKNFVGSQELIKSEERYCLWIDDEAYKTLAEIPELKVRFEQVAQMRRASKKQITREWALKPYKFTEIRFDPRPALVIPIVSSGRRIYIPMGFVDEDTVVYYSSFAMYDAQMKDFGIITSRIHMLWARNTGGQMKSDFRYSVRLSYNTFPFPKISDTKKAEIGEAATEILLTREPHLTMGKTLADLYDPDKMPEDLKAAHERLDDIVESCYPCYPFATDEARLECLFKMYEKMTK